MNSRSPLRRLSLLMASAGLVAGCAQPPQGGEGARTAPAPAPRTSGSTTPPAPAPVAPEPTPALPPLAPSAVPKAVTTAIEMLEAGNEDQAAIELERVLQTEPGHRLAQNLMRQIKDDPVTMLGRESFAYRVQPGESLSRIAQRFLNDVHLFYVLARYNDIKVPRQLAGGQVIRVPGKAPPAGAVAPAPAPTPAPASAPTPAPAPAPAPAPVPAPPPAKASEAAAASSGAEAVRARLEAIGRHTRAARSAFAKQDLNGAIRAWDSVLELDPGNRTAQLERQKAIDLKERLTKVK